MENKIPKTESSNMNSPSLETPFYTPLTSPQNETSPNVVLPPSSTSAITFDIYKTSMMGYNPSTTNNPLQIHKHSHPDLHIGNDSKPNNITNSSSLPSSSQLSSSSSSSVLNSTTTSTSTSFGTNESSPEQDSSFSSKRSADYNLPSVTLTSPLKPIDYHYDSLLTTSSPISGPDLLNKIPQTRPLIQKTFHPKVINPFDDYSAFLGYNKQSPEGITTPDQSPASSRSNSPEFQLYVTPTTKQVVPPSSDKDSKLKDNKDYFEKDFDDEDSSGIPAEFEVRRTLSLKASRVPLETPFPKSSKKVVRFADSLGLDLEVVRMYPDMDQPPTLMDNIATEAMKAMEEHKGPMDSILAHTDSNISQLPPLPLPSKESIAKMGAEVAAPPSQYKEIPADHFRGVEKTPHRQHKESAPAPLTQQKLEKSRKSETHMSYYVPPVGNENQGIAIMGSPMLPFFPFGDYVYQGMENMTIKPSKHRTKAATANTSFSSAERGGIHSKNYFFSPYDHLSFPTRHINLRIRSAMSGKYLAPTFPQPGKAYNFLKRVKDQKVCLEEIMVKAEKCMISGIVRVENIAFHKTLYLRYTVDDWITQSDHLCTYIPGSTDISPIYPACAPKGEDTYENAADRHRESNNSQNKPQGNMTEMICTDKFSFDVVIPFTLSVGSDMYIALLYRTNGKEYWDSNFGRNYQLKCYAAPTMSNSPLSNSDDSTGSGAL